MRGAAEAPRARALAAVVAAAALALVTAAVDDDAPPSDHAGRPSLSVPALQSLVTDGDPLRLQARVRNPGRVEQTDLRVVVTVHSRLTTRFSLQQSLDDAPTTGVVHAVTRNVRPVPARGARTIAISQSREELGLGDADPGAGVHPVRIALQAEGEVLDEVLTAVVVTGTEAAEPLQVTVLLPLTGPPAERPDGRVEAAALEELLDPRAPVPTTLRALQRRPEASVTLAVDGLALATLERARGGIEAVTPDGTVQRRGPDGPTAAAAGHVLDRLRAVAGQPGVDQIALPYGRADLVALARHGAGEEAARHVGDDTGDIERLTGQRPRARTLWPPEGVNAPTLRALRGATETVVLSEADVRSEAGRLTPPPLRRLQTDGAGTLRALVPDPWIEDVLAGAGGDDGALRAARVLAEVASVHLEQPAVADRGLLIAPPPHAPAHGSVVEPLLGALERATFAELSGLTDLRATGAGADAPRARLAYPDSARDAELPASYVSALRRARERVGSLDALIVEGRGVVARLDRRLLQAASTAYRDRREGGLALIEGARELVTDIEQSVTVPEIPPVTLAAEEGTLPVRVRSTADVPLRVTVRLRTAAYEVEGGPTREVELPPEQDQLLSFDVRARAPGGTSPVQVIVTDPHGLAELATGTVVVRSTAVSVAGVVVTAGAALFLALALWRQIARRRRAAADRAQPTGPRRVRAGR